MNKVDIIEITKEFEAEAVVNAVKAYMTPKNETLRMESGCIGGEYIVKLLAPKKAKEKKTVKVMWEEQCSVKLSFDTDICRVNTYMALTASTWLLGAGLGAGVVGLFLFPAVLAVSAVATGASAVTAGVEKHDANKFRKDIIKIVSSFVTDKSIEVKDIEQEELQDKKIKKERAVKASAICSCGKQIKGDMNFCPYCGEKAK
uniref:hypothetical protein n=1 Tax=Acetatifactor sp. TaxID=1872090 RepID=UPI004057BDFE